MPRRWRWMRSVLRLLCHLPRTRWLACRGFVAKEFASGRSEFSAPTFKVGAVRGLDSNSCELAEFASRFLLVVPVEIRVYRCESVVEILPGFPAAPGEGEAGPDEEDGADAGEGGKALADPADDFPGVNPP